MKKKKISIIADDEELLFLLQDFLKQEGYQVKTYSHTTFIDVLEKDDYDLLILDVWFNATQAGVEMAQAIKNRKNLQKKPIIMMSSDTTIQHHASLASVKKFLSKPINFDALIDTIHTLFSEKATPQLSRGFATYTQIREQI
jgi:DNA-binding response OmpR family regulator